MLVSLNQSFNAMKDRCIADKRAPTREELAEAVLEGAGMRVRPVMMTAGSVILGLLPILYGTGTGSEVMSRIAAPMVGGMASAMVLTLLVLPVVFYIWRANGLKKKCDFK